MVRGKKQVAILLVCLVACMQFTGCGMIAKKLWTDSYLTEDPSDYSKQVGSIAREKYKEDGIGPENGNSLFEIFPEEIPESAKIGKFVYNYYNPWDPNYLVYLEYTCSESDFLAECQRLESIESSEEYGYYGVTGFPNTVEAVMANQYTGFTYCLSDKDNLRLMYVQIYHNNYFCDIEYDVYIDQKYLPIGFDAKPDNAYCKKMMESANVSSK